MHIYIDIVHSFSSWFKRQYCTERCELVPPVDNTEYRVFQEFYSVSKLPLIQVRKSVFFLYQHKSDSTDLFCGSFLCEFVKRLL